MNQREANALDRHITGNHGEDSVIDLGNGVIREVSRLESLTGCDRCQIVHIQGIPCHETGCEKDWIDPSTHMGYKRECKDCGTDFIPEDAEQFFCDESCAAIYGGWYSEPDPEEAENEDLF